MCIVPLATAARHHRSVHQPRPIGQLASSAARASGDTTAKLVIWSSRCRPDAAGEIGEHVEDAA
jgi:hypothetical protein